MESLSNNKSGKRIKCGGEGQHSKPKSVQGEVSWEDHPRVRLRPRPPRKSSPSLRIRMNYREVRTREKTRVVEENYPREVVEINPWEDLHPRDLKTFYTWPRSLCFGNAYRIQPLCLMATFRGSKISQIKASLENLTNHSMTTTNRKQA